jgi:hypothetical protein
MAPTTRRARKRCPKAFLQNKPISHNAKSRKVNGALMLTTNDAPSITQNLAKLALFFGRLEPIFVPTFTVFDVLGVGIFAALWNDTGDRSRARYGIMREATGWKSGN